MVPVDDHPPYHIYPLLDESTAIFDPRDNGVTDRLRILSSNPLGTSSNNSVHSPNTLVEEKRYS